MRTRGPNSALNDDPINIQPSHNRVGELPQPRPAKVICAQRHSVHMEAAQHQFTSALFDLGHYEQFTGGSKDVRRSDRIIGQIIIENYFDIRPGPHALIVLPL